MPKLGTKLREGIFVGYDQIVGGGWSVDLYVLDSLQVAASESIYQIYVRRIKAEEVFSEKDAKNDFQFPCATGEVLQPYGNSKSFTRFSKKFISDDPSDVSLEEDDVEDFIGEDRAEKSEAEEAPDNKGDSEDVLDRDAYEKTEDEKEGEDFWSLNGTCLTRHHRVPRTKLFSLYDMTGKKPPIPLDYVDIRRETYTNLESPDEAVVYDTWWLPANQSSRCYPQG